MEFKIQEAVRYLGYKNQEIEKEYLDLIYALMEELESVCTAKYIFEIVDVCVEKSVVNFGVFTAVSKDLSKNLKSCNQAVFFAVTLGTQCDFIIRKYTKISISKAVIINACASALVEDYANKFQVKIEGKLTNKYLCSRFSPGYGDFDLSHQKDILNLLNTQKNIGLTVSDNLILIPLKSITAIIGITDKKGNCRIVKCDNCKNKSCEYRRIND